MSTPFQGTSVKLFQPTQISGCVMWFDAAESSTVIRTGTNVTQWNDKTGNGNTAVAGTATYPVYNATGLNGFPTISLQAANDYFLVSNNLTTTTYPSLCYFIVINPSSSQPNTSYAGILSTDTASAYGRTLGFGAGNWQEEYYSNFVNITPYTANSWAFVSLQFATTVSATLSVNGTTYAGTASGTGNNTTGFKIGSYNNTSSYSTFNANFDTAEILVYGANLTTSQRQQIEGYLAWKWGLQGNLPSNHPYKNTPVYASPPFPLVPRVPGLTNGTVFAPTQISGCQLWLDGADPTTLSFNNTTITQWRDKSGKGYSGNITSGANGPTYNSTSSAVQFRSASSQSLTLSQAFGNSLVNTTLSIFVVGTRRVLGVDYFLATGNANTGEGPNAGFLNDAMEIDIYGILLNPPSYYFTASIPAYAGASEPTRIYGYNINTSFYDLVMNGTVLGTLNTSIRPTVLTNPQLGSRYAPGVNTAYHSNDINEMLVYVTSLSTAQRQNVEGYLAWKWGLTASLPDGHPYKTPPIAPFSYGVRKVQQNKWQPLQISGCSLWLDGLDPNGNGNLPANNASMSTWIDKSGNGNNATTVSGSSNPVFLSSGILKKPTMQFNATNFSTTGSYSGTTMMSFNSAFNNTIDVSVFGVMVPYSPYSTNGGYRALFFFHTAGNGGFGQYFINFTPAELGIYLGPDGGYFPNTISRVNNTAYLNSFVYNANATLLTTAFNGTANNLSTNGYKWGSTSGGTYASVGGYADIGYQNSAFNGEIYELLTFNAALNTQQRQQVEGYLAWKWGLVASLPTTHPYKLWPPSP